MIRQLQISSFKCIQELDIAMAPLTVLTGANNAGKSTITQSMLLVSQSERQLEGRERGQIRLSGPMHDFGVFRDLIRDDASGPGFSVRMSFSTRRWWWWFEADPADPIRSLCSRIDLRSVSGARPQGRSSVRVAQRLKGRIKRQALSSSSLPSLAFVPADRVGPSDIFPLKPSDEQRWVGHDGAPGLLYQLRDEKLGVDDPRRHPDRSASLRIPQQVAEWMRTLFPGFDFDIQPVLGAELVRLGFRVDRGHDFRKPRHLGFGVSYAFPVVVASLCAKPGSVVVVDSPEVHLHPRVQSELGRLLALVAASGVQVVTETHSEHVINAVRIQVKQGMLPAENVSLLYFGDSGVVPIAVRVDGSIEDWPRGFFDESLRQLDELL